MQFFCADIINYWAEASLMQKRHHTASCWDRDQSRSCTEWTVNSGTGCSNARHRSTCGEGWYPPQCPLGHPSCWSSAMCGSEAWSVGQWWNTASGDPNNQTSIAVLWNILCAASGYGSPQQAGAGRTLPHAVHARGWQTRSAAVLGQEESTWGQQAVYSHRQRAYEGHVIWHQHQQRLGGGAGSLRDHRPPLKLRGWSH